MALFGSQKLDVGTAPNGDGFSCAKAQENGVLVILDKTPAKIIKKRSPLSKRFCFTLNNYSKSDIEQIIKICGSKYSYIFETELGENGTPHLQGYIEYKLNKQHNTTTKNKDSGRFRARELFGMPSIHFETCKGSREQNIKYCSKDYIHHVRGCLLYKSDDIKIEPRIDIIFDLYKWQTTIRDLLLNRANDRHIYYIYNRSGNIGKSAFVKYMIVKWPGFIYVGGSGKDLKYAISSYLDEPKNPPLKGVFLDVPREHKYPIDWSTLEEVKNGVFFSSKYESKQCICNPIHICIFANVPVGDLRALTKDRWQIYKIVSEREELLKINIVENDYRFDPESESEMDVDAPWA